MKNIEFWIPFVTWVIAVIAITFFIFSFYEISPLVMLAYAVIVLVGFLFLLRTRKKGSNTK